eukprot:15451075-Alexandrium_andersonii.AAC.1
MPTRHLEYIVDLPRAHAAAWHYRRTYCRRLGGSRTKGKGGPAQGVGANPARRGRGARQPRSRRLRSSTLDSQIASDFNSQARLARNNEQERPFDSQIASDSAAVGPECSDSQPVGSDPHVRLASLGLQTATGMAEHSPNPPISTHSTRKSANIHPRFDSLAS